LPEFGEHGLVVAEHQHVAAGAVLEVIVHALFFTGKAKRGK
jgi:hypothetical protein